MDSAVLDTRGGMMRDRIEQLKSKVDKAKLDLARAEERLTKAKEDLATVEKEIEAAGCTPDTIDDEIAKLEKDLETQTAKLEKEVSGMEEAVKNGGKGADAGITDALQNFDE